MLYNTQYNIQQMLVDIYNFLKQKQEKKNGMVRKSLLGKSIDYGARSVITAPRFNLNRKMMTSFEYTGVPLSQICSLFFPFIMYYLKRWVEDRQVEYGGYYKDMKMQDMRMYYDDQKIKAQVDKFIFSYSERFELVEVPLVPGESKQPVYFDFTYKDKAGNEITRNLTWCDVIYQSAYEATLDKHVWITRYPLIDYFGTFTTRISVLSTLDTEYADVNGKIYETYPHIDLSFDKKRISTYFQDTISLSNVYLEGLGGDYKLSLL